MKNMSKIELIEKQLIEDYSKAENDKSQALNNLYQLRKEEEKLNANIYFFETYLKLLEEGGNDEKEQIGHIMDDSNDQEQFDYSNNRLDVHQDDSN